MITAGDDGYATITYTADGYPLDLTGGSYFLSQLVDAWFWSTQEGSTAQVTGLTMTTSLAGQGPSLTFTAGTPFFIPFTLFDLGVDTAPPDGALRVFDTRATGFFPLAAGQAPTITQQFTLTITGMAFGEQVFIHLPNGAGLETPEPGTLVMFVPFAAAVLWRRRLRRV